MHIYLYIQRDHKCIRLRRAVRPSSVLLEEPSANLSKIRRHGALRPAWRLRGLRRPWGTSEAFFESMQCIRLGTKSKALSLYIHIQISCKFVRIQQQIDHCPHLVRVRQAWPRGGPMALGILLAQGCSLELQPWELPGTLQICTKS